MSLFPAYAEQSNLKESKPQSSTNAEWLENSSFHVNLVNVQNENISEEKTSQDELQVPSTSKKRKKKRKRSDSKKKKTDSDLSVEKNEYYKIELLGARELLTVPFISRPSAPIYKIKYWIRDLKNPKSFFKSSFKRYHKYVNFKAKPEKETAITLENLNKIGFAPRDEQFLGFKQEEELTEKTAFYNSHLGENPTDIKVWLEYIHFQDVVHQFEKTYRKGSMAKAQRVLAERKLSILEKALTLNHNNSEVLQRERLTIAVTTFPSDELQVTLFPQVIYKTNNLFI